MNPSAKYLRRAGLFSAKMPDGQYAILDAEHSVFYGLNEVGARIWEMMETSNSLGAITSSLLQEYAVTEQQCILEVDAFVENMTEKSLIERAE